MKQIDSATCPKQTKYNDLLLAVMFSSVLLVAATFTASLQADPTVPEAADELSQTRQSLDALHFDNSDVLIISVGSSVYSDFDRDGFFTNFSLSFDADVRYGNEWVYARIFLRASGEDYLFFHTSDAFEIYESSSFDEYRLESELVSNYPAGYYDVRIELRDAFNDRLLDIVDASTHSTLFALPLESRDSSDLVNSVDTQILGPLPINDNLSDPLRQQIVRERVGASYALLPLLGLVLLARKQRRLARNKRRLARNKRRRLTE